jgi:cytochrome c oxidase subunit 2
VDKWWSVLFGVTMAACLGMFIAAPFAGWWLPPGVSTHAWHVDKLFYIILFITGFFFILTEAILVYFMWVYAGRPGQAGHVFGPHPYEEKVFWTGPFKHLFRPVSAILHNQHRVELAWTFVPAVILLYIAFAQVGTWLEVKDRSREPSMRSKVVPIQAEVSARQFEWRVRYPSSYRLKKWLDKEAGADTDFKSFGQFHVGRPAPKAPMLDDVHLVNEVHIWKEQTMLVHLDTLDVIHSFNVPHMRVKQDALPGKTIPVWFTPTEWNTAYNPKTSQWEDAVNPNTGAFGDVNYRWEIACAELCGWGHHRMIGRVYVHKDREDFFKWLRQVEKDHGPPGKSSEIAAR